MTGDHIPSPWMQLDGRLLGLRKADPSLASEMRITALTPEWSDVAIKAGKVKANQQAEHTLSHVPVTSAAEKLGEGNPQKSYTTCVECSNKPMLLGFSV